MKENRLEADVAQRVSEPAGHSRSQRFAVRLRALATSLFKPSCQCCVPVHSGALMPAPEDLTRTAVGLPNPGLAEERFAS